MSNIKKYSEETSEVDKGVSSNEQVYEGRKKILSNRGTPTVESNDGSSTELKKKGNQQDKAKQSKPPNINAKQQPAKVIKKVVCNNKEMKDGESQVKLRRERIMQVNKAVSNREQGNKVQSSVSKNIKLHSSNVEKEKRPNYQSARRGQCNAPNKSKTQPKNIENERVVCNQQFVVGQANALKEEKDLSAQGAVPKRFEFKETEMKEGQFKNKKKNKKKSSKVTMEIVSSNQQVDPRQDSANNKDNIYSNVNKKVSSTIKQVKERQSIPSENSERGNEVAKSPPNNQELKRGEFNTPKNITKEINVNEGKSIVQHKTNAVKVNEAKVNETNKVARGMSRYQQVNKGSSSKQHDKNSHLSEQKARKETLSSQKCGEGMKTRARRKKVTSTGHQSRDIVNCNDVCLNQQNIAVNATDQLSKKEEAPKKPANNGKSLTRSCKKETYLNTRGSEKDIPSKNSVKEKSSVRCDDGVSRKICDISDSPSTRGNIGRPTSSKQDNRNSGSQQICDELSTYNVKNDTESTCKQRKKSKRSHKVTHEKEYEGEENITDAEALYPDRKEQNNKQVAECADQRNNDENIKDIISKGRQTDDRKTRTKHSLRVGTAVNSSSNTHCERGRPTQRANLRRKTKVTNDAKSNTQSNEAPLNKVGSGSQEDKNPHQTEKGKRRSKERYSESSSSTNDEASNGVLGNEIHPNTGAIKKKLNSKRKASRTTLDKAHASTSHNIIGSVITSRRRSGDLEINPNPSLTNSGSDVQQTSQQPTHSNIDGNLEVSTSYNYTPEPQHGCVNEGSTCNSRLSTASTSNETFSSIREENTSDVGASACLNYASDQIATRAGNISDTQHSASMYVIPDQAYDIWSESSSTSTGNIPNMEPSASAYNIYNQTYDDVWAGSNINYRLTACPNVPSNDTRTSFLSDTTSSNQLDDSATFRGRRDNYTLTERRHLRYGLPSMVSSNNGHPSHLETQGMEDGLVPDSTYALGYYSAYLAELERDALSSNQSQYSIRPRRFAFSAPSHSTTSVASGAYQTSGTSGNSVSSSASSPSPVSHPSRSLLRRPSSTPSQSNRPSNTGRRVNFSVSNDRESHHAPHSDHHTLVSAQRSVVGQSTNNLSLGMQQHGPIFVGSDQYPQDPDLRFYYSGFSEELPSLLPPENDAQLPTNHSFCNNLSFPRPQRPLKVARRRVSARQDTNGHFHSVYPTTYNMNIPPSSEPTCRLFTVQQTRSCLSSPAQLNRSVTTTSKAASVLSHSAHSVRTAEVAEAAGAAGIAAPDPPPTRRLAMRPGYPEDILRAGIRGTPAARRRRRFRVSRPPPEYHERVFRIVDLPPSERSPPRSPNRHEIRRRFSSSSTISSNWSESDSSNEDAPSRVGRPENYHDRKYNRRPRSYTRLAREERMVRWPYYESDYEPPSDHEIYYPSSSETPSYSSSDSEERALRATARYYRPDNNRVHQQQPPQEDGWWDIEDLDLLRSFNVDKMFRRK